MEEERRRRLKEQEEEERAKDQAAELEQRKQNELLRQKEQVRFECFYVLFISLAFLASLYFNDYQAL